MNQEVQFDARFDTAHRGQSESFNHNDYVNPEADKQLAVKFFLHPLEDETASLAAGRLICNDTQFIEIRVRGDRNMIQQRPARPDDKRRFRDAWKAFEANEEVGHNGTLLKEWPSVSRSMVEELKYLGFYTVEQLAAASDGVCAKVAGLQNFKQKAILFLEAAKGAAPIDQLMKKLEEEKNEKAVMGRNLQDAVDAIRRLERQVEQLEAKKGK